MNPSSIRVTITGAAGQVGYALVFRIASGEMFGPNTKVNLQLLECQDMLEKLESVAMELADCAFPLLESIDITTTLATSFHDADWIFLIGSAPRRADMERRELLRINGAIFASQGRIISRNAKISCKILVVGNPCNTNAYITQSHAPNIPAKNFFALTMLDQNRACCQLALKAKVHVNDIANMAIWGNHSSTQYPNFFEATINGRPAIEMIQDHQWLKNDFLTAVQKRGSVIIKARGSSSAASAAHAIVTTVQKLCTSTPQGESFSLAVRSNGSYGIDEGLLFSFPVRSNGKDWEIIQGISLNEFSQEKIKLSLAELREEKKAVSDLLGERL